jgi:hypothetical protein
MKKEFFELKPGAKIRFLPNLETRISSIITYNRPLSREKKRMKKIKKIFN